MSRAAPRPRAPGRPPPRAPSRPLARRPAARAARARSAGGAGRHRPRARTRDDRRTGLACGAMMADRAGGAAIGAERAGDRPQRCRRGTVGGTPGLRDERERRRTRAGPAGAAAPAGVGQPSAPGAERGLSTLSASRLTKSTRLAAAATRAAAPGPQTLLRRVAGEGAAGRRAFPCPSTTPEPPPTWTGKVDGGFHCLTGPAGRAAEPSPKHAAVRRQRSRRRRDELRPARSPATRRRSTRPRSPAARPGPPRTPSAGPSRPARARRSR